MENSDSVTQLLRRKLKELKIDLDITPRSIYATIIAHNLNSNSYDILSLGSGMKCLPDKIINEHADCLVHDMHAEEVCRRAFLVFLYEQLIQIFENKKCFNNFLIFDPQTNKYCWNPQIDLLFYTSQSPCKTCWICYYLISVYL